MGQNDTLWKRYFSDKARFADLIIGVLGAGKELITPGQVMDMDSQVGLCVPELVENDQSEKIEKDGHRPHIRIRPNYRDLIRKVIYDMNFIVIGIENQEFPHYLTPVRCMGYDLREYERQAFEENGAVMKDNSVV